MKRFLLYIFFVCFSFLYCVVVYNINGVRDGAYLWYVYYMIYSIAFIIVDVIFALLGDMVTTYKMLDFNVRRSICLILFLLPLILYCLFMLPFRNDACLKYLSYCPFLIFKGFEAIMMVNNSKREKEKTKKT